MGQPERRCEPRSARSRHLMMFPCANPRVHNRPRGRLRKTSTGKCRVRYEIDSDVALLASKDSGRRQLASAIVTVCQLVRSSLQPHRPRAHKRFADKPHDGRWGLPPKRPQGQAGVRGWESGGDSIELGAAAAIESCLLAVLEMAGVTLSSPRSRSGPTRPDCAPPGVTDFGRAQDGRPPSGVPAVES